MKKIIYLLGLFCSISLSAQKSYEQYKQERQYAQRYANEQKQQFFKNVETSITRYNTLVNQYVNLVQKHKSTSYVDKNYYAKIAKPMWDIQFKIQSSWNLITYDQSKRFDEIRKRYLITLDAYGD